LQKQVSEMRPFYGQPFRWRFSGGSLIGAILWEAAFLGACRKGSGLCTTGFTAVSFTGLVVCISADKSAPAVAAQLALHLLSLAEKRLTGLAGQPLFCY
jgi:hypothetical protein